MLCRLLESSALWSSHLVEACTALGIRTLGEVERDILSAPADEPTCIVAALPPTLEEVQAFFARWAPSDPAPAVLLVAVAPTIRTAVEAMRLGASDVLEWPWDAGRANGALLRTYQAANESAQRRSVGSAGHRILARLKPGERQVLDLMLLGKANKNIAASLSIAVRTVEARRRRIFQAFQTRSLVAIAEQVRDAERFRAGPGPSAVPAPKFLSAPSRCASF